MIITKMPPISELPRYGAGWLDFHAPGWYNGGKASLVLKWRREDHYDGVSDELMQTHPRHIELDLLDLASGTECVLGQVFGGTSTINNGRSQDFYGDGIAWVNYESRHNPVEPDWVRDHIKEHEAFDLEYVLGFNIWDDEHYEEEEDGYVGNWDELTETWKQEITYRRERAARLARKALPWYKRLFRRA